MDTEQLRTQLVSSIDRALNVPWPFRKAITPEDRRLLMSQRRYWQEAGEYELRRAVSFLEQEPPAPKEVPPEGSE